jgi:hypothetical protein
MAVEHLGSEATDCKVVESWIQGLVQWEGSCRTLTKSSSRKFGGFMGPSDMAFLCRLTPLINMDVSRALQKSVLVSSEL